MHKNTGISSIPINSIEEPIVILSIDFVILDLNSSSENLFKIKGNSVIGDSFSVLCSNFNLDIQHPSSDPWVSQIEKQTIIWKVIHSKTSENNAQHILIGSITDDEQLGVVSDNIAKEINRLEHNNPRSLHHIFPGQSVHLDKKTLEYVTNTYLYMENIIAEIPVSVYWMNKDCIYLGCSNSMAQLLKLTSRHDIIGKTYADLYNEQSAQIYKEADRSVMDTGIALSLEEPLYYSDGTKSIYLSNKVPWRDSDGKIIGMLGISVDITERKKMEEDLKLAKEVAEASAQSKATFIANMSHDLRTPLSGIIGLSTMMKERMQNLDEKQNAHWIHESGEQLLSLLNGILDVVAADNLGEGDLHNESFDLRKCIEGIVQLELPTTKSKNLDLRVNIHQNIPSYIISDRIKLHRVLLNLLGNAIKFTKIGSITIEVTLLHHTADHIHLQFSVTDTGIGIPLEQQDKVFDRFSRVIPSYKGTHEGHGVGLHIAQSYVTLLGGHITVTSQEGVGTTFHFDLPCKRGKTEDALLEKTTASAQGKIPHPFNKPHTQSPIGDASNIPTTDSHAPYILLVEDNPIALSIIESLVKATHCPFESVTDGERALELATTHEFDLILTDIGLPGISGHQFTEIFRRWEKTHKKSPIPIIGLTAHLRNTAIKECLLCGMNDVYTKPATLVMIQKILKEYHLQDTCTEANNSQPQNKISIPATPTILGKDLPNTEDELFAIDAFLLFSPHTALEYVGDKTLLIQVLNAFLSSEQQDIHKMTRAYEKKNWGAVEQLAHKLKGGLGYTGLLRMGYACQYLERYYKAGHRDLDVLDKLYQQVITINQESIKAVKLWLKKMVQ
jgi:two-component system aerobic respiration control sensor histidine kinase ArcB